MDLGAQIKKYWIENLESNREENLPNWIVKKKRLHEQRGNKVPRITGKGHVYRILDVGDEKQQIEYRLGVTFLIKRNNNFYHEEEERTHQALFYKGTLVEDKQVKYEDQQDPLPKIQPIDEGEVRNQRFEYDRRAAVQYAERWWNDYNPEFEKFDVDCTNFVSQCLYAGGAPMRGAPNRSNGWWYQNETWSYSWAVAHSLRWYLSGSNQGLIGKAVDNPTELRPGDIICYDFQGDGRWDHNTIVVAKDADGMPLVNAHTDNSRHRYWSYEDSAAWTEDCKYKFFQIGE